MSRDDFLKHYGIKDMHWGVRRYQNEDGSLTPEGKERYRKSDRVFVSGSSKTQFKDSGYFRGQLPKVIKEELSSEMNKNSTIMVGDAPGVDRQVQNFLKKNGYKKVEVYSPGTKTRYLADKDWKSVLVDAPEFEVGSKEWLAKKRY